MILIAILVSMWGQIAFSATPLPFGDDHIRLSQVATDFVYQKPAVPRRNLCRTLLAHSASVPGSNGTMIYSAPDLSAFFSNHRDFIEPQDLNTLRSYFDRNDFTNIKVDAGVHHLKFAIVPFKGRLIQMVTTSVESEFRGDNKDSSQRIMKVLDLRVVSMDDPKQAKKIRYFFDLMYENLKVRFTETHATRPHFSSSSTTGLPFERGRDSHYHQLFIVEPSSAFSQEYLSINGSALLRIRHTLGISNSDLRAAFSDYQAKNPDGAAFTVQSESNSGRITYWFLKEINGEVYKILLGEKPRVRSSVNQHWKIIDIMPASLKALLQFEATRP